MMLSGHAKIAGIAGWPVSHSLSPRLHGYWLARYGVDGAYVPLPIRKEDFAAAVRGLRASGFRGLNVTIPHKEAAFALADNCDEAAVTAGAANLLVFQEDGRIFARNTDWLGLKANLVEGLGERALTGAKVVLLGAGGSARAAILALAELEVAEIAIVNRSPARAEGLVRALAPRSRLALSVQNFDTWPKLAVDAGLVLNTTSAGMKGMPPLGLDLTPLPKSAAVCDIVYNPLTTDLLAQAQARGHRTVDGLGMLMHQAVPAFAAFYGIEPKVTPELRAELVGALNG